MKYTKKQIDKSKLQFEIEVDAGEFDKYYDSSFEEFRKQLEVDGFRKGNAPIDLAKKQIDPSLVVSYAAEECIKKEWNEVVNKEDLEAISQPKVEIKKIAQGNPFVFTVEIETLPEIKLPDYRAIAKKIEKKEIGVEKKELDDAIKWLLQSRATFSQKEEQAKEGDLVEIIYNMENIEGEKEKKDRFILGKGHFVPGLEKEVIGMKKGENKEIEVDNPKEKGKKINISLTVDSVQEMEIPELSDEFAKNVGFKDLNDLNNSIEENIKKEKEMAEKQRQRNEAIEKISAEIKTDIPAVLIEREVEYLLENLKSRIKNELRATFEEYLKKVNKTEEQIKNDFEKIADGRVKTFLAMHAIEKQEKIEIKSEDVDKRIEEIAIQYPDKDSAKRELNIPETRFYIEEELKKEKIFNLLGID